GIKAGIILLATGYAIYVTVTNKLANKHALFSFPKTNHWKTVALRFLLLVCISLPFMFFFHPDDLFIVARKNLGMLIGISFFYSVFSVFPQEFLYRTFFYTRYADLFPNRFVLIFANAFIFSLAHIVFLNGLVLAITFVGGIIFSLTYFKTKSVLITSVEHSIYGCWIFAVGMGEMLAFPMPT
ncbi:MAG: membrane protease YdiL (CAAX protease family), partial [bacterium]